MTAINLSPISASAAVTHRFSLDSWHWPPCPLRNRSRPLTTSHSSTWPVELFGALSHHAASRVWGFIRCLTWSICPVCVPVRGTRGSSLVMVWFCGASFTSETTVVLSRRCLKTFCSQEGCKTWLWKSHLSASFFFFFKCTQNYTMDRKVIPWCDFTSQFRVLL